MRITQPHGRTATLPPQESAQDKPHSTPVTRDENAEPTEIEAGAQQNPESKCAQGRPRRMLVTRDASEKPADIEAFARQKPELLIAQWISVLDKIATKPSGKKHPAKEQRDFRERLGKAMWAELEGVLRTGGVAQSEESLATLHRLWQSKVHPYPSGNAEDKPRKEQTQGNQKKQEKEKKQTVRVEGAWYGTFCSVGHDKVDCAQVAAAVKRHLHEAQLRIDDKRRKSLHKGLIQARAESISGNFLKPDAPRNAWAAEGGGAGWGAAEREQYLRPGDPVAKIHARLSEEIAGTKGLKPKRALHLAAAELRRHYAQIFGEDIGIAQARTQNPGLLALHQQVKDTYRQLLKRMRKPQDKDKKGAAQKDKAKLARNLPRDLGHLLRRTELIGENKGLNHAVRLGRVIHYHLLSHASETQSDAQARRKHMYGDGWESGLEGIASSRYWLSEGQAEIQQTEALARNLRRAVALMARTLRGIARLDPKHQDVLYEPSLKEALKCFDDEDFKGHVGTLFGRAAEPLLGAERRNKTLFKFLLLKAAGLRNSTFHFNDLLHLQEALGDSENKPEPGDGATANADSEKDSSPEITKEERRELGGLLSELWREHQKQQEERVVEALEGCGLPNFAAGSEIQATLQALLGAPESTLPLPRFNKLEERARNNGVPLIEGGLKPNRDNMEKSPHLRCQYVVMKALYERPFRSWAETRLGKKDLAKRVKNSVEMATQGARKINAREDEEERLILSKAEKMIGKRSFKNLAQFLADLTAETATEMRVQQGYSSDAEQSKKQAQFIGNLQCDVLASAFETWLKSNKFTWLKDIKDLGKNTQESPRKVADIHAQMQRNGSAKKECPAWQSEFYALLYLLPATEASALLHQLRKWLTLAGKGDGRQEGETFARRLVEALTLYLDMHDAVHSGGEEALHASDELKDLKNLFSPQEEFEEIFPLSTAQEDQAQEDQKEDRRLPVRGLREMIRFGGLAPLKGIFSNQRVTSEDVKNYVADKEKIADLQRQREELHQELCEKNSKLSDRERSEKEKEYADTAKKVEEFRHLAAQVTLTNHVRLHQLMTTVLARFADCAGLWERDLYFVALAWLYQERKNPAQELDKDALDLLCNGQAVFALHDNKVGVRLPAPLLDKMLGVKRQEEPKAQEKPKPASSRNRYLRNRFAHFDMLKLKNDDKLDLTDEINHARTLMAYDRKLKNAVSKSVKNLLRREGLDVTWKMTGKHQLEGGEIKTRCIKHLAGDGPCEALHGKHFVKMVAALFCVTANLEKEKKKKPHQQPGKARRGAAPRR